MPENAVLVNFSGGETSPKSRGRFDTPWYQASVRKMLNFIADTLGPARFRSGFRQVRQTRGGAVARLVAFQINADTGFELEFTAGFMRVYLGSTGDLKTTTQATITGISHANPAVVTVASASGLSNGKELILSGIVGIPQLNGRQVVIGSLSGNTFQILDPVTTTPISTTGLPAYASGGVAALVYEIVSPFTADDLAVLQWAQEGTSVDFTCGARFPYKLTVADDGTFTLGTFTRKNDPFSADATARSVAGVVAGPRTYIPFTTSAMLYGARYAFASVGGATQLNGNTYQVVPIVGDVYAVTIGIRAHGYVDGSAITFTVINGALNTQLQGKTFYGKVIQSINDDYLLRLYYDAAMLQPVVYLDSLTDDGNFTPYLVAATVLIAVTSFGISPVFPLATAEVLGFTTPVAYILDGGADVDSRAWSAWTSGGTATPVREYPVAVTFYEGRKIYLGTSERPDCVFASRAPDDQGNARYDDFTGGSDADFACFFQLAPVGGSVPIIAWGRGSADYLFIGTFGGPYRAGGSGLDFPITPTSINVRQFDTHGCAATLPAGIAQVFFIQRDGKALRGIKITNPYLAIFESRDLCLNADQIGYSEIQRVTLQQGRPDVLWVTRADGTFAGLSVRITAQQAEEITGWHAHVIGGASAKVLDFGVLERSGKADQLWAVTERTVNGVTRRCVEVMAEEVVFPDPEDFFTGDRDADLARYLGAVYTIQGRYVHVDAAGTYDGSARGTAAAATLTPSAVTGAGVTLTAGAAVFTTQDVGLEVWKKPDPVTGLGAGRATITGYTDSTHVTATVTVDFDSVAAVPAGSWYFAATAIYGLSHLEGAAVAVVTDGAVLADGGQSGDPSYTTYTVANGSLTLSAAAAVVHVGLPYTGLLETHNLEIGARNTGPAQDRPRTITEMFVRLMSSLGVEYGTDPYKMTRVENRLSDARSDRPAPVFSGIRRLFYQDTTSGIDDATREKKVVVMQRLPLPATVEFVDVHFDATDEA